jgi:hypothetical protein
MSFSSPLSPRCIVLRSDRLPWMLSEDQMLLTSSFIFFPPPFDYACPVEVGHTCHTHRDEIRRVYGLLLVLDHLSCD